MKKLFSDGSAMWIEWRMIGLLSVYVGQCGGSRSLGRPQKKWIDTVNVCLKKKVWVSGKQEE